METIRLEDFLDPKITHLLEVEGPASAMKTGEGSGKCGFGQRRRLGLFEKSKTLVSFFATNEGSFVALGDRMFRVSNHQLKKEVPFPFVRRFEIWEGCDRVFSCCYFSFELDSWPHTGDIFEYILEVADDHDWLYRFEAQWLASRSGLDLSDETSRSLLESMLYEEKAASGDSDSRPVR